MLNQNESELLSAFLDRELVGDELALVQDRLANSMEWRAELETLQETKFLAMSLPNVNAPVDLLDFLEKQSEMHVQKTRSSFWNFSIFSGDWNRWAMGGTLATAALFAISIGVHRMHENAFIPLEPLLAAHANASTTNVLQQNVLNASFYSARLKENVQK